MAHIADMEACYDALMPKPERFARGERMSEEAGVEPASPAAAIMSRKGEFGKAGSEKTPPVVPFSYQSYHSPKTPPFAQNTKLIALIRKGDGWVRRKHPTYFKPYGRCDAMVQLKVQ